MEEKQVVEQEVRELTEPEMENVVGGANGPITAWDSAQDLINQHRANPGSLEATIANQSNILENMRNAR